MNFELFIDGIAAILSNIHVHFWQLGDILCDFVHRAVLSVLFHFTINNLTSNLSLNIMDGTDGMTALSVCMSDVQSCMLLPC